MLHDEFFWLTEINKATVVVNHRIGLLPEAVAKVSARGVAQLEKEAEVDAAKRVKTYIAYEPLLTAITGPEVTIMHAGRSSQDMLSTVRLSIVRENAIGFAERLDAVIGKLLDLAAAHKNTIVPNYTNGVAAQPNSYAHYLLGFVASLLRDRERLAQFLSRTDGCPMGATVLNGTGWPLDRDGMAHYLGYSKPRRNAFDCTCLAPVDMPLELSTIVASVGMHVGSFIDDIMVQYAQPRPWILLAEGGENTYVSSAMPQKRNPGLLNNCRADASDCVAEMAAVFLRSHNVVPGMVDGKNVAKNGRMVATGSAMLERFMKVLTGLRVNPERALEELNSDWTASQEIADRLMREYQLPFRIGHHMASSMVGWARANNVLPHAFPYSKMCELYRAEIAAEYPEGPKELPMSEAEFKAALDPAQIVAARRTAGSCAPKEVEAMLAEDREQLATFAAALSTFKAGISAALEKLEADFTPFAA